MSFPAASAMCAQTQVCTACETLIDTSGCEPLTRIGCPRCGRELIVDGMIGHFELLDIAGFGGLGVVYKARDVTLDRLVALKLLRKAHSDNLQYIAQLEREAAITASIIHPSVVSVYSTGTDQGRFYIAMELVDQGSLDDLIRIHGRISEAQVLQVGIQIAEGLRAAHEHGLIHRDVKPGNILFADVHTAKIVDFGLALSTEQGESARGEIWGTPYYIAPEKLVSQPEDFRSDIYSLGGTLYHALTGQPPFEAETASLVALAHVQNAPAAVQTIVPEISSACAYVIDRALRKDPSDRFASYDQLIQHLEHARNELVSSIQQRLVSGSPEKKHPVRNGSLWVCAAAALILLLVLATRFASADGRPDLPMKVPATTTVTDETIGREAALQPGHDLRSGGQGDAVPASLFELSAGVTDVNWLRVDISHWQSGTASAAR